jgi:death-on-curing protein
MFYLSKAQIVAINKHQIQMFGGNYLPPQNFLHEENLDYLLEIIDAELFGNPLYPNIWDKAGLYCFNIIANHVFQDGNKRTGLQTAIIFLRANGFTIQATDDDLIAFATDVASGKFTLADTQQWFKDRLVPLP